MSDSIRLAQITAIVYYYLQELQKLNLITPSIGKSYPDDSTNREYLIIHNSYRKIQQLRINNIKNDRLELKNKDIKICWDEFIIHKTRLNNKINFLKDKFKPQPFHKVKHSLSSNKRKIKNKKSKERYYVRQMKKKFKSYNEDPKSRTVINLSSHQLSMAEIYVLEMGYGFIPTPNNKEKEEEFLILEGLRFVDRVGKIDSIIAANGGNDHSTEPRGTVNDNASADGQTNTFTRDKSTPKNLYYSQPKEPQLTQNVTKTLVKEFNELNSRLIDNVTSGPSKRYNLPKTARQI